MIRIANGQGFWGDSIDAPVEQVTRGPIGYLTLDGGGTVSLQADPQGKALGSALLRMQIELD